MIHKLLSNLTTPRFGKEYIGGSLPDPQSIPTPQKVTLLLNGAPNAKEKWSFKEGDTVNTGQKLSVGEENGEYVISSVTGTISAIYPYAGDFGRNYTAIAIEAAASETKDEQFSALTDEPTFETVNTYLKGLPGNPPLDLFLNEDKPIQTIIVNGLDNDLLVATNQYFVVNQMDQIKTGIEILRKITAADRIWIVVPRDYVSGIGEIEADIAAVDAEYPETLPHNIIRELLGQDVPAGKTFEDLGIAFFSAEAVASIGKSFESGEIPENKMITLIDKRGERILLNAKIGTPISDIFKTCSISANDKDRIIVGGPMRGSCIYREDHPVLPDTDALFIQDESEIALVSDYPCINCGDCIRVCPARISVNMLVRFLEAGQYESAADEYDLYSCIECGLCSYVCVSKIPIFQYIRLAKYELDRTNSAEATND